jgi:2-C-methyl-D-erythritol 4-phosphate cytidylyltransferase
MIQEETMKLRTGTVGVILAAGGVGTRMKTTTPKQFLLLNGKPIAQHSLDLFDSIPEIAEIVIVCAAEFRHQFSVESCRAIITFAEPGSRRQDSVYNGLQALTLDHSLVCVHDAARPYVTRPLVERVFIEARKHGAAVAAMPVKFTIKEANALGMVVKTPDRALLWEIQTPQVIELALLKAGFDHAHRHQLTVTDDVSLVEHLGEGVKLVEGCYSNIKITTPEDYSPA